MSTNRAVEGAPGSSAARWARVAKLEELAGPGPHAAAAAGRDLVVVRGAAGLRAFEGRCPHQGALLGEGELEGGVLVCRNHRWRFDAESGQRQGGPQCLRACPLEERGGELFADLQALAVEPASPDRDPGRRRRLSELPGPRTLPLLGNFFQLSPERLHLQLERWAATYGSPYVFGIGPRRMLTIADPTISGELLRARPESYRRVSLVESVFDELGLTGVFSAEGEAWRPQRRLAMEALSNRHLRGFYGTLETVAERLRGRWAAAADDGAEIDLQEDLKRFTVDVTTQLVFGYDLNTIAQGDDVIQRRLELIFPALSRRLSAALPYWRLLRLPADRRLDRALAELRGWLGERIEQARARLAADPALADAPTNFMEAMLSARDEAGRPFSDPAIFGNALTMLLAGEDTTAYTLGWAVHELTDRPAAVTALRAELDAALGADAVPRDLDRANGLAYAGAVAQEAMRLRPVAPLIFLESNQDVVIGDVEVPRGTGIALLTRVPVLDPQHFAAPREFRPERWLDEGPGRGAHDPSVHRPFGSGPRICPGRTLALLEMRVVLAMLYKSFDVERIGESSEVEEIFSFTMAPRGLRLRLRRRRDGGEAAARS